MVGSAFETTFAISKSELRFASSTVTTFTFHLISEPAWVSQRPRWADSRAQLFHYAVSLQNPGTSFFLHNPLCREGRKRSARTRLARLGRARDFIWLPQNIPRGSLQQIERILCMPAATVQFMSVGHGCRGPRIRSNWMLGSLPSCGTMASQCSDIPLIRLQAPIDSTQQTNPSNRLSARLGEATAATRRASQLRAQPSAMGLARG